MDNRYAHPDVARVFSLEEQYRIWLTIERTVVHVQQQQGTIPEEAVGRILDQGPSPEDIEQPEVLSIMRHERDTQHDVAAFLKWWRSKLGADARHTHLGLTSSDLVDTTMGYRFAELEQAWWREIGQLESTLYDLVRNEAGTVCLGFTHGQPAEPTSLGIRAQQWQGMVLRAASRLSQAWSQMRIAKLSGPVGTYAHNPTGVELAAALLLGLEPHGPGASQVVPRDRLAHWASCAAQLVQVVNKIAVDFRLMAARGEVQEGWPPERIGSSAMPHKRNPVTAEKLAGMARLAQGYASMLQPVDLWDERDISHSSVERVAVPDLLHVLFHSVQTVVRLLTRVEWDRDRMRGNLEGAGRLPYTSRRMNALQVAGSTPDQARKEAVGWSWSGRHPAPPRPEVMLQSHPLAARLTSEQQS